MTTTSGQEKRTLWIVTAEAEPEATIRRGARSAPLGRTHAVDVERLRQNMTAFLEALQEMLAAEPKDIGDFRLAEVEVSAEITAEGSLRLLGTGVSGAGTGGIRFVLRRVL